MSNRYSPVSLFHATDELLAKLQKSTGMFKSQMVDVAVRHYADMPITERIALNTKYPRPERKSARNYRATRKTKTT